MSVTGTEQPTKVGVPIADLLAGMNLALRRAWPRCTSATRPGVGRVVRTSLLSGVVGVHAFQGTRWLLGGEVPGHRRRAPPRDRAVRDVRDRDVAGAGGGAARRACGGSSRAAVGLDADDARFATNRERVAHRDELVAVIEAIFAAEPAEHWLELLLGRRHPGRQGALDGRRLRAGSRCGRRGWCSSVDHPAYGRAAS